MKKILNVLLICFLLSLVIYGAYTFGDELNKEINNQNELKELQKQELKLEIQLKKILLDSLNNK